ncbi:hypothetical protein [Streptomyces natalensis]|uniref:hypothetical protein n=1 Tax=Streptomyces natalensis TaxID=68242 RepID=UPI000A4D2B69|nr:hypothetical protein [Streptomyces natalensis]
MCVRGGGGAAVLKHYYRLVYWKRRIGWALGWRGAGQGAGLRGHPRGRGRGARRIGRFASRAWPFVMFGLLVAVVVALSALLASAQDPFGMGELGVRQPSGWVAQR